MADEIGRQSFFASRVLVLHHGAAIAEGPPSEVVRDPAVVHSYLGVEAL